MKGNTGVSLFLNQNSHLCPPSEAILYYAQFFRGNTFVTKTRLITALTLLPVVAFFIQMGGWWFFACVLVIALLAVWEFIYMMRKRGHQPTLWLAIGITVLGLMSLPLQERGVAIPVMAGLFMLSLTWQLFQKDSTATVVDWALTIAGAGYIGVGLGHLWGLRLLPDGAAWVWLALFSTWGTDTYAYMVGKKFGRHKFFPRLSPKKTWEGVLGGIVGGVSLGVLVSSVSVVPLVDGMLVGALIALVDPFGDLSISMMKRYAGVKDSSHLFPGHGGMLDRTDSVIFAVIVSYYYVLWVVF